jgi:hypothetical protein
MMAELHVVRGLDPLSIAPEGQIKWRPTMNLAVDACLMASATNAGREGEEASVERPRH